MALMARYRPLAGLASRSLLASASRTFTSLSQTRRSSCLIWRAHSEITALKCCKPLGGNQIRLKSEETSKISSQDVIDIVPVESKSPSLSTTNPISSSDLLKWEVINPEVHTPIITGAILPFVQMNFIQKLFFPYTYALMYYLDFLAGYLPWWGAIVATTATARLLFFPLVVKQNIIGIKANNVLPETQKIQKQLNEAMCSGDSYGQAIAKTKLNNLFQKHGITIKDRLLPVFIQAPIYMSFFFLLRRLTDVPVEGLKTGGILWFTDLTLADPYYILPLITSGSMLILMEFGLEGGANPKMMTPMARYVMRALPFGIFLLTYHFPAATLLFWSTSNLFTLSYAMVMKTKMFKKAFNVPPRRVIDPSELPMSNMSFKSQVKQAVEKTQATKTSADVRRLDDIAFRKAGIGPLRKTYKEPPKASAEGST